MLEDLTREELNAIQSTMWNSLRTLEMRESTYRISEVAAHYAALKTAYTKISDALCITALVDAAPKGNNHD